MMCRRNKKAVMGNNDRELVNQNQEVQEAVDIANNPMIKDAIRITNDPDIQYERKIADIREGNTGLKDITSDFSEVVKIIAALGKVLLPDNIDDFFRQIKYYIHEIGLQIEPLYSHEFLLDSSNIIKGIVENYNLIYCHPDDMSDEDIRENEEANNKIVTEIFKPDKVIDNITDKKDSAIITLSPVNDSVLKYLSENPEAIYQLTDRDFEIVMAEIYNKLGYKVKLTKETRDGGKDIIIREPGILGDFIYYVECKKYAAKRHIGVGLVRNLVGTINTDRVNGGILATTSYFTPDAKKFVTDNKYDYQIQMHDYNKIKEMLNRIV